MFENIIYDIECIIFSYLDITEDLYILDTNDINYKKLLHSWKLNSNYYIKTINNDAYIYYCNGKIHRDDDLPAIVNKYYNIWYKNGKIHRDTNNPAIIDFLYGRKSWYKNGKRYDYNLISLFLEKL